MTKKTRRETLEFGSGGGRRVDHDQSYAELGAELSQHFALRNETQIHQDLADFFVAFFLELEGLFQLVGRDEFAGD